jgi:SAM-dependent methyltransferase
MSNIQLEIEHPQEPAMDVIAAWNTAPISAVSPSHSAQSQTVRPMNPREEIIMLLRGQLACPVISCLGELGWLDRMADGPFDHTSFPESLNPAAFRSVMQYLATLQLIDLEPDRYRTTSLGARVFRRAGAFCILNSYESYMRQLRSLLLPDDTPSPEVCRKRNVIGSGAMHGRKFFVPALAMLEDQRYDVIADVGCGDGQFLSQCSEHFPEAQLLGIDLSPIAVEETLARLQHTRNPKSLRGITANGADIDDWSEHVLNACPHGLPLISMWFLLHEISQGRTDVVVEFFTKLHARCPRATLLIGEVVKHSVATLARYRSTSVLPELTLLHELSGQGLLSWDEWQEVARRVPYRISGQQVFDAFLLESGEIIPSNFIWKLTPHQQGS